jgi:Ca2+-binding EF-hand superfamily protein
MPINQLNDNKITPVLTINAVVKISDDFEQKDSELSSFEECDSVLRKKSLLLQSDEQMWELFNEVDADKDNKITRVEMAKLIDRLTHS